MNKYKILGIFSAIGASLAGIAGIASAEIIPIPSYADVITTTSTSFATSLFTDLLPWLAVFIGLVIAGMLLVALKKGILGGIGKVFGGRRRGGRGRRGRR